jgi:DNA-binding transcriptional regulator LsrR (DeoR family)
MPTEPVEEMSPKDRRMFRAAKLHYRDGLDKKEIASELDLAHGTVRNYFSSGEIERFKRFYSDMEKMRLKQMLEQQVKDGYELSNGLIGRALEDGDASPRDKLRASKLAMENRQKLVSLLQELGALEKQAEKVEDVSGGPAEVSVSFEEVEGDGDVEELSAE